MINGSKCTNMISLLAKELGEERCKCWAQKESVDKVVEEEMNEQV